MRLFVDTSAWFALNDKSDQNHPAAEDFMGRFRVEPVVLYLTDYIVDETVTLLSLKVSHNQAVAFLDLVAQSQNIVRSHVTPTLLERAEELFRKHQDKNWSYTDCVSFAFMDDLGLEDALTFDTHFSQYGKQMHP